MHSWMNAEWGWFSPNGMYELRAIFDYHTLSPLLSIDSGRLWQISTLQEKLFVSHIRLRFHYAAALLRSDHQTLMTINEVWNFTPQRFLWARTIERCPFRFCANQDSGIVNDMTVLDIWNNGIANCENCAIPFLMSRIGGWLPRYCIELNQGLVFETLR